MFLNCSQVVVLRQQLSVLTGVGAVLVMSGMVAACWKSARRQREQEKEAEASEGPELLPEAADLPLKVDAKDPEPEAHASPRAAGMPFPMPDRPADPTQH